MHLWQIIVIRLLKLSMVAHACNSSTRRLKLEVQDQPRLHSETYLTTTFPHHLKKKEKEKKIRVKYWNTVLFFFTVFLAYTV